MTSEKLGLAAVLFAAIVGIIQLVKPRLVRMLDREEAALAAAAAENIERRELLQQELLAERATTKRLRELDRESILQIAQLQAEKALAEGRVDKLQVDAAEAVERLSATLNAVETERDQALERARAQDEELVRLRTSAVQLRAENDLLRRGE